MEVQKEYWYVVITGILSGFIVFGGQVFKDLGFSLMEMSVLLYFPTFFFLIPFLKGKGKQITNFDNLKLIFLWALIGSIVVITQFGAVVAGASVAVVVLLLYTQPVWTILISKLLFRSRIGKREVLSIILVLAGLVVLVKPWGINETSSLSGIIIALLGGISLSGWVIVGSYIGKAKIDPYVVKFVQTCMVVPLIAVILIILAQLFGQPQITKFSFNWSFTVWAMIIIFNLLTQPISHILYLKGSKVVPANDSGIILLLEPVSGAILATVFLRQPLTLSIIAGGAIILLSNYLVITKGKAV